MWGNGALRLERHNDLLCRYKGTGLLPNFMISIWAPVPKKVVTDHKILNYHSFYALESC